LSTPVILAHGSIEGIGELWNGLLHPLRSPAHLLVLAGLGLFAGQRWSLRSLVSAFLIASIVGLSLTQWQTAPEPPAFLPCALSAALGAVVALRKSLPRTLGLLLFACSGLILGWDSTPEAAPAWNTFKTLLGVWAGLAVLLLNLAGYAKMPRKTRWIKIAFRVAGSWIMAISLLSLALALRK
jgi:hydrogenase/urease accessory protein HupE